MLAARRFLFAFFSAYILFVCTKSTNMKKSFHNYPFLSRILLAMILGFAALLLSGIVYSNFPIKPYFPFVAEVLLVLVTWLLYRTDGQNLSTLGLNPSLRNIGYLFGGLALGAATLVAATWLRTLYTGEVWQISPVVDTTAMVKGLYYILPTVMVQELMFRGYLFTKTISRYGVVWSNVIFSIIFMLVHVVDREVLQNPVQIVVLVVVIPVGHLWFAAALLRSKTIFFPIGLHWGNNWAVQYLIGVHGKQHSVFHLTDQKVYTTWLPLVITLLIFNVFFLLVTLSIWKGQNPFRAKKAAAA